MEQDDTYRNKICWSENPDGYPLYKKKEPNKEDLTYQKTISETENLVKKTEVLPHTF